MALNTGFVATLAQGDAVTLGVAVLLLAMSVLTWVVLILKVQEGWHDRQMAQRASTWRQMGREERAAWRQQASADDPYARLHDSGLQALRELERLRRQPHPKVMADSDWVTRHLQNTLEQAGLQVQRHLTLLASVGATAPFVGLLGTVWGIYHALAEIGQSGLASIDQVAGPVGEALIMTAFGLAVAIPAVLAYNGLVRMGKNRLARWREFAGWVHAHAMTEPWEGP
ncbi:MAG: hypothetical protein RIT26_1957 [Pseudomonadota bacterium]